MNPYYQFALSFSIIGSPGVMPPEILLPPNITPLVPPVGAVLKKGGGTYHLCYEVPDMHAAIEHLREKGSFLLSGPVPAVAFEMREIAWLMTEANLLVELVASTP